MRAHLRDAGYYALNHVVNALPSRRLRLLSYRLAGIQIGDNTSLLLGVRVSSTGRIRIGKNTVVNDGCLLDGRGGLMIGDNVSISTGCSILTADHDLSDPAFAYRERPVRIDDYVWLGAEAMVLPGVHIGRGAVVAARAVVARDVEPLAIVGGVPAKIIGRRSPDALQYTLDFRPRFG